MYQSFLRNLGWLSILISRSLIGEAIRAPWNNFHVGGNIRPCLGKVEDIHVPIAGGPSGSRCYTYLIIFKEDIETSWF
ncbi:hypothetical protein F4818DRAFT_434722 [Hypoxylon cercidicola]|nr:hypothetical protein F4818DRAFT_434722 [Hypoxylon cercidicola]